MLKRANIPYSEMDAIELCTKRFLVSWNDRHIAANTLLGDFLIKPMQHPESNRFCVSDVELVGSVPRVDAFLYVVLTVRFKFYG